MGDPPQAAVDWRALEESAEDLYDAAPCGYFSTLPNGQFVKVNRTFLDWTGFSRDSLLTGRRFQDLLTVPGKIYHDTHFGPLLQMQGRVSEVAFDIVGHDGHTSPVLVNAVEVKDETGKPLLNRATIFNATDRRTYERELLAARRKAEEIARAKADTLNMVSHDIRNLLTGIIGATRRLQTGELPADQQQRYLGLLRASAENMMLLANNLLAGWRLASWSSPRRASPSIPPHGSHRAGYSGGRGEEAGGPAAAGRGHPGSAGRRRHQAWPGAEQPAQQRRQVHRAGIRRAIGRADRGAERFRRAAPCRRRHCHRHRAESSLVPDGCLLAGQH